MMNKDIKQDNMSISSKGFTMLEMLVSMGIAVVVMGAIFSAYQSQQRSYVRQDQVAGLQQNLRAALYIMTKDIRMAGWEEAIGTARTKAYLIDTATSTAFAFKIDNGDGANNAGDEITYTLTGDNLTRQIGTAAAETLAENIEAICFAYAYDTDNDDILDSSANNHIIWAIDTVDDPEDTNLDLVLDTDDNGVINAADDTDGDDNIDGVALAAQVPISQIRGVKVWVLARTANKIQGYKDTKQYVVGNSIIQPEEGYIYNILTAEEKCRNLFPND
jgi:type IV pilus assembly protein PilW